MKDALLRIYHNLPGPFRSMAATLRGLYLRSWRYGPETDRLVEEALDRETWTPDQWKTWQEERLAFVLHRAATQVPFYRNQWAARRRAGDKASWEVLQNWPILEKESVRENSRAFIADECDVRRMFCEHTSGTTGKSLNLWWSKETVRKVYALSEARIRHWNGVSRRDRWGMIGGQLVVSVNQRRPPFWVWNQGLNQLYLSSYHLAPNLIGFYLDAIKRYRITYLYGYTSSLYALARGALDLGRTDICMTVVIANAEPVYDYQRNAIAKAFNCPVRETYGMAEIVAMASECKAGRLHLWPEFGMVEVIEDVRSIHDTAAGDLVSTGLLNVDMPFIRYRIGDRVTLENEAVTCQCARALPAIRTVEGRKDDVLLTIDGRRIGRLDPIFKGDLAIREAQIIQESLECVRVRYVPAPEFSSDDEATIIQRLQARVGGMKVVMEQVTEVPREPNGKFRGVICRILDGKRPGK